MISYEIFFNINIKINILIYNINIKIDIFLPRDSQLKTRIENENWEDLILYEYLDKIY